MPSPNPLGPAHRGYAYQDTATAYFMADLLARQQGSLIVDRKLAAVDRFDDLTQNLGGRTVRRQFKHSSGDRKLKKKDFLADESGLQLDKLVDSYVQTRSAQPTADQYRICVTWGAPDADEFGSFLVSSAHEGSFEEFQTTVYRFNATEIWPIGAVPAFACLENVQRDDFINLCKLLVIEVGCPNADEVGIDGPLNNLLQDTLHRKIGIGIYPNDGLKAPAASKILIERAYRARVQGEQLSLADIELALDLRRDYGRVAQQFPVDQSILVKRSEFATSLKNLATTNQATIVSGPPGSGKSWTLDGLANTLKSEGYLVAKHFCYLEPGDPDVARRISTRALFGNLIAELVDQDPQLRKLGKNPYSAGPDELVQLLPKAVQASRKKQVVLIIDGLDHIARVLAHNRSVAAEETDIVDELAALNLPPNVHVILGSQPGAHLDPIVGMGAASIEVPGWADVEVIQLSRVLGLREFLTTHGFDASQVESRLCEKSGGNPLLTTYISREILQRGAEGEAFDPVEVFDNLPSISLGISDYYEHLLSSADLGTQAVANTLGALDFSLSEAELMQVLQPISYIVPEALRRLAPVLKDVTGQGGIQVYHESFRRFILERLSQQGVALQTIFEPVIHWLDGRNFYDDAKAYRFMLPLLRRSERDVEVVDRVNATFVADSLAAFHPKRAILANLDLAASAAATLQNLPALARFAHLKASVEVCFEQKLDLEKFATTYMMRSTPNSLAERLLFDGRPTFSAGEGLSLCVLVDQAGGQAPWREYLRAEDTESSEEKEDQQEKGVSVDSFRGLLRTEGFARLKPRIVRFLNKADGTEPTYLKGILKQIRDLYGSRALIELRQSMTSTGFGWRCVMAGLARALVGEGKRKEGASIAKIALGHTTGISDVLELAQMGGIPSPSLIDSIDLKAYELDLGTSRWGVSKPEDVRAWVDSVLLLGKLSTESLEAERLRLEGESRYREWLRYVVDIATASGLSKDLQSAAAKQAFIELATETNVFAGTPRGCDLYPIRKTYERTITFGLKLLDRGEDFKEALKALQKLSQGTTSYLDNSPSGPLTSDRLAEIILPFSGDPLCGPNVVNVLAEQAEDSQIRGEFYEVQGEHELALTLGLLRQGNRTESDQHWIAAARFLTAYGYRKDTLLFELVDTLEFFAQRDAEFAQEKLAKIQPLVSAATTHTDGRETKHLDNHWFSTLLTVDSPAALWLLARSLTKDGGRYHWKLEVAIEEVAKSLSNGSPDLRSYLFSTLPLESVDEDRSLAFRISRIEEVAATDFEQGRLHLMRLCAECQGDPAKFSSVMYQKVEALGVKLGIGIPIASPVIPERSTKQPDAESPATELDSFVVPTTVPGDNALKFIAWINSFPSHYLPERLDSQIAADSIWEHLVKYTAPSRKSDCIRILRYIARKFYFSTDAKLLAILGDKLAAIQEQTLASVSYALAFTQSRGSGGWGTIGGQKQHRYLKAALEADEDTALVILCQEVAEHIHDGSVYGIGRHIVELAAEMLSLGLAKQAWGEIETVLEFRLPLHHELPRVGIFGTYRPNSVEGATTDESLFDLLLARISDPELARKHSALSACASVIRRNPELVAFGFKNLLREDAPDTSRCVGLRLLQINEANPFVISKALLSELQKLVSSKSFTKQWIGFDLLRRAGQSSPLPIASNRPILLSLRPQKVAAILGLDLKDRIGSIKNLLPAFEEELASDFEARWQRDKEQNEARARNRYELRSRTEKSYPPTPLLLWQYEVFEGCMQEQATRMASVLMQGGQWDEEELEVCLGHLNPNLISLERWWGSRSVRPQIPLPSEFDQEFDLLSVDEAPLVGWKRCALYETQVVGSNFYGEEPAQKAVLCAGLVAAPEAAEADSRLPFGQGDSSDWFEDVLPIVGKRGGPAVGLTLEEDYLGRRALLSLHALTRVSLNLHLERSVRFALVDENGAAAVIFRRWSAAPLWDSIDQQFPRISGCDLVMRPDVFTRLEGLFDGGLKLCTYLSQAQEDDAS